jgi:hypothetical protein
MMREMGFAQLQNIKHLILACLKYYANKKRNGDDNHSHLQFYGSCVHTVSNAIIEYGERTLMSFAM